MDGPIVSRPSMVKARRSHSNEDLNITSMMDMFTIILVFLLKSYSTEDISVAASSDLELPVSTTQKKPELAVNLVVAKSRIVVDGVEVLSLTTKPDEDNPGQALIAVPEDEKKGQMITKLYDRLLEKAEQAKALGEASGSSEHEFKGQILLQCDKTLPFAVIREVMYTAGQAQFGEFRFVVYKSEG
ncbi:MAG: biopolymer transporter ExbD [Alphaproteobacteria bacterium]|nr:biopolymer transporter ExbD [Alphaproteobacteria bacterium]